MRRLYGDLPATGFGPLKLKAVRQAMIDRGWCRQLVNRHVNRIKRFFKWAVSEELIPSSVFESVRTVDGLHAGRSNVREAPPVLPVAPEVLDATIPFMSPQVASMVWLQRLTGMRPGEVVQMRPCDLDCSDEVWVYAPVQHKTRWRGRRKQILLGPKAQSFIQPFLNRAAQENLFQPIEAEAWRSEQRRKARKSPLTPSQSARKRSANRLRPAKNHYTEDSYRRAVDYAIKRANRNGVKVPHWFPNQIRHTYGTEVRKKFGIEAAQVALGHARCDVTEVYAERNLDQAREIARTEG
jgi:integrase